VYYKLQEMVNQNEEYQISKDINRTYPEQEFFKEEIATGNNKLYNVLKAYANYDGVIGYV
jgi:hypothetical protein